MSENTPNNLEPPTGNVNFVYKAPDLSKRGDNSPQNNDGSPSIFAARPPILAGPQALDLGTYRRKNVSNLIDEVVEVREGVSLTPAQQARAYFDMGLRLHLSYQHELAAKCFSACLEDAPYAALAHGLVALCHSPNYNFKGRPYYESACHVDEVDKDDAFCIFPSQQVAERHSRKALEIIDEVRRMHRKKNAGGGKRGGKHKKKQRHAEKSSGQSVEARVDDENGNQPKPALIGDIEVQFLQAIRVLTCNPGIAPDLSDELVGRPYANAMKGVHEKFKKDPEAAYLYAEALLVLNAWELYEYPSGKPVSPDVDEVRSVLEEALDIHPNHAGLCHMYVHLSEMSKTPQQALRACPALRDNFRHAGHLIHMPTHIDVLIGNYESCVRLNQAAIVADTHVRIHSPLTAEKESFYFGYIVHNYHMAVYGAILGGMEGKAMEVANELNELINERTFEQLPELTSYLESYAALDIHVMVRFGRWQEILQIEAPRDKRLMLYRAASLHYGRAIAFATMGKHAEAKLEAERMDGMRGNEEAHFRILHNNSVADLLAVDSVMMRGELAYHTGDIEKAFRLLRKAVSMQDNLKYDEPWGKMQPIRHALGGLLLEQNHLEEAIAVFRKDLEFHPRNPWALIGLIRSLKAQLSSCCESTDEIKNLQEQFDATQALEWADYKVSVPCECCKAPDTVQS